MTEGMIEQAREMIDEAFDRGEGKAVDRQLFAAGVFVICDRLDKLARAQRKAGKTARFVAGLRKAAEEG